MDYFPDLFQPTDLTIPGLTAQFERLAEVPNNVANINVVPFVGALCVVIMIRDHIDMPGGTLEPDELYLDAAKRELLEEAGAKLLNFQVLGGWKCVSSAAQPYRPHMPHPEFYRLVGYGDVEIVSAPENPADGEQVTAVELVTVQEAAKRFRAARRADLAELYEWAASVRSR